MCANGIGLLPNCIVKKKNFVLQEEGWLQERERVTIQKLYCDKEFCQELYCNRRLGGLIVLQDLKCIMA